MNYRDLDEFVAKHGTQHNLDLPYKEAVNQVIRKDFIENVRQKKGIRTQSDGRSSL